MSLSVQNIVDDLSYESRLLLDGTAGSGGDFNLLVRFIDQTHKDALHTGLYFHHLRAQENISDSSGTPNYTMSATNVARIEMVYDRTFNRLLLPFTAASNSGALGDPASPGASQESPDTKHVIVDRTQSPWPEYYQLQTVVTAGVNAHTLWVFPAPQSSTYAGTLEVHYIKEVVTLTAASDKLQIPEDGRDLIVSGCAVRMFNYLKRPTEAATWQQTYEMLKRVDRMTS